MPQAQGPQLDVGHFVRPLPGELACGDMAFVCRADGVLLVALVDGLGHGPSAARAAEACTAAFGGGVHLGVEQLLARAHEVLRMGRGAVASIARFSIGQHTMEFAGVGNVAGVIVRPPLRLGPPRTSLLVTPGVLGSGFRKAKVQTLPFEPGDTFVMYTDGVRGHFDAFAFRHLDVTTAAREIVSTFGKSTDDAGCVLVRSPPSLRPSSQWRL